MYNHHRNARYLGSITTLPFSEGEPGSLGEADDDDDDDDDDESHRSKVTPAFLSWRRVRKFGDIRVFGLLSVHTCCDKVRPYRQSGSERGVCIYIYI